MITSIKQVRFYPTIALLLLIVNIIGFGPTYFFKPVIESPELPFRTHIHGIIFTCWLVLFALQAFLVRNRNIKMHRFWGRVGGFLALAMILSALQILYYRALEFDGSQASLQNTALVVCGNIVLLMLFALNVGLGIQFRRNPAWHKRFMLLACIAMMPQSLGRIGKMPVNPLINGLPNEVFFGLGGMLLLIIILWTHDLFRTRKIHPVSGIGGPVILVAIILAAVVLPKSEFIWDIIIWLNKLA
ncbi:hypothetical protein [Lentiprolixibacter aurantiacus]|uniref:DUF2306 domain-containing protein n=1 Tax=Lentiprolixibacter aurantiacus TaxID=2993939 RepID=A0AAE3MIN5_9FLAO|nr:hypothetical protein [Lentiprolixibacter aurantiacus]MCX2718011.1 hypothetical protein [Lentiprolixibacter aurantiacus]